MPDRAASAVRGTGGDHADRYLVAGLVAADGVLYGAIDDCGRTALSFVYDFILMPTEGTPDDLLVAAKVWETETTEGLIFT